jgi:hypothetical protein
MRGAEMFRLFKRSKGLAVEFCERCSQVYVAACRPGGLREGMVLRALQFGVRV